MSSADLTQDDGSVEELSMNDVLSGLKSVANKLRLPGQPKIPLVPDDLDLPTGIEVSEHWQSMATALAEAQGHAQALLDDWDQQQRVVATAVARGGWTPHRGLPFTYEPPWRRS